MVSDALWEDLDQDGMLDLVIVGEWMAISMFKNERNKFSPMAVDWVDENNHAISTKGWWNCVSKADLDNDGDMDFMLGNQGLNGVLKPMQARPVYLYKGDLKKTEVQILL